MCVTVQLLEAEALKYGFLVSRFKAEYYWWEVVLLARSGVLVACLILLDQQPAFQAMAGAVVLVASLYNNDVRKVCVFFLCVFCVIFSHLLLSI